MHAWIWSKFLHQVIISLLSVSNHLGLGKHNQNFDQNGGNFSKISSSWSRNIQTTRWQKSCQNKKGKQGLAHIFEQK